jgi:hypothetical protein
MYDIAIFVRENFFLTLRHLMTNTLNTVQRWCETKESKKPNVLVFTSKYKSQPMEPLRLREGKLPSPVWWNI